MKHDRLRLLCLSGIFAALVFVCTAWLHIPSHTGYTHIGDAFIYLAGSLLPLPYAMAVGAVGGVLADCLTGYGLWAPGTLVVKVVTALCFSRRGPRVLSVRNLLGLIPAWLACIGGYYLYEALITGNFTAPLAGIPGYVTQSVLSSAVYVLLGLALDKLKIKHRIGAYTL